MPKQMQEIIMALVLVLLAVFLLNPFGWWMPSTLVLMVVLGMAVVFALFAGFVWHEEVRDEREALLRQIAGRIGFVAGMGIATLGIVIQAFVHAVDPWLVGVLAGMVIAKIFGRSVAERHR